MSCSFWMMRKRKAAEALKVAAQKAAEEKKEEAPKAVRKTKNGKREKHETV